MQTYRTILIDLDGTLVDSNDAHANAWTQALRDAGIEVAFSDVRERIGMDAPRLIGELAGFAADSPLGQRIVAEHAHLFESLHLPSVNVLPGARDLLARIKHEGLTLVLTAWSSREQTLKVLEHAQLLTAFDHVAAADGPGGANSIVFALAESGTTPAEALLVGDTPYDVAAARAAGVAVVGLRSGGWPDHALRGAIAIYSGAVDLLTHFGMSPLSRFPEGFLGEAPEFLAAPEAAE